MDATYIRHKRDEAAAPKLGQASLADGPSLEALRSGAAKPTREQLGHQVDLPEAMRDKMESAFGADLSAVKLYESQAVADAGASAMTQGSNIAFAPGMLDFSSYGGQALLGHELSHVVSQARGEVTGGGFLNEASLESRADREGAMAAAGQTVAPPVTAMSGVSAAAAAGPMQAGGKHADPKAKVLSAQQDQVDDINAMIDLEKAGKKDSKAYRAKNKHLGKAKSREGHWRGKMTDRANKAIAPTEMKVLDSLDYKFRDGMMDEGEYFDNADSALGIMGITGLNPDMRIRLQDDMNNRYASAKSKQWQSLYSGVGQQRANEMVESLDRFKSKYQLI